MNIILKQFLLIKFLLLYSFYMLMGQPPVDGGHEATQSSSWESNCVQASLKINYTSGNDNTNGMAHIVDLNCLKKTNFQINAEFTFDKWNCWTTGCDYRMELRVCGKTVQTWPLDQETTTSIHTNINATMVSEAFSILDEGKTCEVELVVIRNCWFDIAEKVEASVKTNVKILNSAKPQYSYYDVDRLIGAGRPIIFEDESIRHCCCADKPCTDSEATTVSNVQWVQDYVKEESGTTTKHILNIDLRDVIAVSGKKGAALSSMTPDPYEFKIEWITSSIQGVSLNNSVSISQGFDLLAPPGECVHASFAILTHAWATETYKINCDEPDELVNTYNLRDIPNIKRGQLQIWFAGDVLSPNEGCRRQKNLPATIVNTTTTINGCRGDIHLGDIETQDLDLSSTRVWWTNDAGEEFEVIDLIDVPFGTYTLHLEDDCCNSHTETRTLCPNKTVGSWFQNEDQFCREISCGAECSYEECVTPDNIVTTYIQHSKKCKREYYYNSEKLGEDLTLTSFTTNYNPLNKQCIRVYSCEDSDEGETIQQNATFGQWTYNIMNHICERAVICFNEIMPSEIIDTESPDIVFQNNLCISSCGGFPSHSFFPINTGFWQWNSATGCTRQVTCINTQPTITDNGTASYSNWRVNAANMCNADVSCDNTPVFGAIHTTPPTSQGSWDWASNWNECRRYFTCNGQQVYQSSPVASIAHNCPGGITTVICANGQQIVFNCMQDVEIDTRKFEDKLIHFYPNPANDIIYFQGLSDKKAYTISIMNTAGDIVIIKDIFENNINISELLQGVYFFTILENGNKVFISKFIKI